MENQIIGENFVSLVGKISYPNIKIVGDKNSALFNGKLAIPDKVSGKFQYIKISAWRDIAEALNSVSANVMVKIHGHIEERSYDSACKHCGNSEKKYWTSVVVDNFFVMEDV